MIIYTADTDYETRTMYITSLCLNRVLVSLRAFEFNVAAWIGFKVLQLVVVYVYLTSSTGKLLSVPAPEQSPL